MKATFALFLTAVIASAAASTDLWTELRVKFAATGAGADVDSFWEVQPTLDQALANDWVRVDINNRLGLRATAISAADFGVNPLYDDNGFLAGIHVAQPAVHVYNTKPPSYNPLATGANELKTINGVLQLTSTFLLVDPQVLAAGGRTEIGDSLGQGLWLRDTQAPSGYWRVSTNIPELNTTTPFNWQNCIPGMGIHYYYDVELNVGDCSAFYPWFVMGRAGSVTGVGWQIFSEKYISNRDWYDSITGQFVNFTVPRAPTCMAQYADSYGVTSIHFYFVSEPWTITCDQATESVVPLPI